MNNKRLENVKKLFEEYVENGHAAGASVAVFRIAKRDFILIQAMPISRGAMKCPIIQYSAAFP